MARVQPSSASSPKVASPAAATVTVEMNTASNRKSGPTPAWYPLPATTMVVQLPSGCGITSTIGRVASVTGGAGGGVQCTFASAGGLKRITGNSCVKETGVLGVTVNGPLSVGLGKNRP